MSGKLGKFSGELYVQKKWECSDPHAGYKACNGYDLCHRG